MGIMLLVILCLSVGLKANWRAWAWLTNRPTNYLLSLIDVLKDTMQRFLTSSSLDYTYAQVLPEKQPVHGLPSTPSDILFEELKTQTIK